MFDIPIFKHTFIAILIVVASGLVGIIIKILLGTLFKRLFTITKTTIDDRILEVIKSKVVALSILFGFFIGIREIRKGLIVEDITFHQVLDYLAPALYILVIFVIAQLVSRLIRTVLEWYMDEVSAKNKSNVTSTVVPLLTKITNIILFLVAGMIILDHFGVNIGSLLVSLGVGSLAIALAAQETVANTIAGFVILVDQPFRVGDQIKLPSGEEGDVQQIGFRSTRILNVDNNLIVVPNSELIKNHVINYSFPNSQIRVLVEVGIAYGTDLEKAKKLLLMILSEHTDIMSEPEPRVFLTNFMESAVQLRLVARTSNFDKKFEIETNLREKIYDVFAKEGIEIPFPQRVVRTIK